MTHHEFNHLLESINSQSQSLVFVSADLDLNTAAMAEGLPVEDPNTHP